MEHVKDTRIIDLAQLKLIQLNIMDMLDSFCRENGIQYFITAGTLIGALRHKGYIPWDDDIDIVMLRKDYELLLSKFPIDGRYRLYSIETDSTCIYPYAKVYDSNTIMIEGDERDHPPIGVNIDIFPLENATDNYQDAKNLKKEIFILDQIMGIKHLDRANRGFIKNITVKTLRLFANLFSYPWLIKSIIHKSKKYINNTNSRFIVNAVIYAKGEREILEREWFAKTIDLEFEGRQYKAPVGADQYMRRLFGDYMQLPPEEKRVSHHRYQAYFK